MKKSSNYPVDAVITWVDGGDQEHQKKMTPYIEAGKKENSIGFRTRYDQVEEVKYTVDSILKFAKFIRYIYIVTDAQIPLFLKKDKGNNKYKNVRVVDHTTIFKGKESFLPVFNSRSIETRLYRIPNLSEHFIYFNDDMFLIKEIKLSDFFVNGFPVLRGTWKPFYETILYKKIFSKKNKKTRANHRKGQELGAKTVGFKKFYKFDHVPYALRKSTFLEYFSNNKEVEKENVSYRFRDYRQFIPQSLANHIEIQNKTCILKKDTQLAYFQNYKKPFFWLKYKLRITSKNHNKLFLNMQGLDQCPEQKLNFILNWLEKTTQ